MSRSTTTDALLNTLIPVEATGPASLQQTELGPLPAGWRVARLGEVVSTQKGRKPKHLTKYLTPGALPYLTAHYFRTGSPDAYVLQEDIRNLPTCSIDDIIMIWDGSKSGQVFTGLRGVLASTMVRIDTKSNAIEKRFLYFLLVSKFEIFNSQTTGSTIPHVSKTLFHDLPIPLPPLPEQRAIAHVLRTVQKAREATERVIAALRDLKRSLMHHLFTYGPVPMDATDQVALRDTPIGPIPAHWRVVRLGEVVEYQRKTLNPQAFPNEQFEYYSIPAYQVSQVPIIEKGDNIRSQKIIVTPGIILFGKLNPRVPKIWQVKTVTVKRKIASTEFIALMPLVNMITSDYLYYLAWSSHILPKAQEMVSGSTPSRQRIDVKAFLKIPVPLPPLDEQRQIARILQTVDRKIEAEEARKEALEGLFKSLLHHLMTAKIRLPAEFISQFGKF